MEGDRLMRVRISKGAISRNVRLVELCFTENPHLQSRESYERLRLWYISSGLSAGYTGSSEKSLDSRKSWIKFRKQHLGLLKKERGFLRCEYCGKGPLRINGGKNVATAATLDHATPLSGGGSRYDESNLKVACLKCNQDKSNMSLWKWNVARFQVKFVVLMSQMVRVFNQRMSSQMAYRAVKSLSQRKRARR